MGRQWDAVELLRGRWRAEDYRLTMEIRRPGQAILTHDGNEKNPETIAFSLRGKKIVFVIGPGDDMKDTYTITTLDRRYLDLSKGGERTMLFWRLK